MVHGRCFTKRWEEIMCGMKLVRQDIHIGKSILPVGILRHFFHKNSPLIRSPIKAKANYLREINFKVTY